MPTSYHIGCELPQRQNHLPLCVVSSLSSWTGPHPKEEGSAYGQDYLQQFCRCQEEEHLQGSGKQFALIAPLE